MTSRREFLRGSAACGAGLLAGGGHGFAGALPADGGAKLELLVLGGTGFIGPHLVRHAVARGHRVTIFTRGRHDAELPAGVVRLKGDRKGDLKSLEGKSWDAVVDDSATNPDWVRLSTDLLKGKVGRYLFTSSTGVHYPYLARGLDETAEVRLRADDPKDLSATYGADKANCERIVRSAFGAGGVIVRPTYIVGPGDTSDRFPYWPQRLVRGGETLAPGRRDDPVQFIDVRDLAEFMVHLLEAGGEGIYNVAGPQAVLTMPEFLEQARAALHSDAQFIRIDDYDFLTAHKIEEAIPWAMLRGNDDGMMSIRHARAESAGLTYRPLADTVRDTRAWWDTEPEARRKAPKFAISPQQEAKALAAWKARKG
ncbi:NAD-dependent epimerase/dehydratase family protein [Aquisphaera insulae]|uniref:NAD-dependent epimerase/dehydratase family protein n=1 Tax=Aquisphaera insulae TaxID=2712864 RepID=UPI0013EA4122|nr:NAD-dependent epimerase/dehydratase family protein [Aquisphaera insulae]